MKKEIPKILLSICLFIPCITQAQFDFYGPEQFGDILGNSYTQAWNPNSISAIANNKYVVILDQATQSNMIMLNAVNREQIDYVSIDSITGLNATYGSMMRSVFQMVDENTHFENDPGAGSGTYIPLSGNYKLNPLLHSYYNLNSDDSNNANSTDGGTFYIDNQANTGYVLVTFEGTPSSSKIKAISQFLYNSTSELMEENTGWATKYLMISGSSLTWTTVSASASIFLLADATDLLAIEIADGSDFNPTSISYQPNATADIPSGVQSMDDSRIIVQLPNDIDTSYANQLGNSTSATAAATLALDEIETTLTANGDALRYPKSFYLALRENMLSHVINSSDIYNGIVGRNTVEHIYFTNATNDAGVPHPFMVIASHDASTRPNMLVDVHRPPGALQGVGYAQTPVTRNSKLGEFLVKIPLKDYGLIAALSDNDLSSYGDLASDFDAINGGTTTPDVYNYTGLSSIGLAVDGVTIYPAKNNNLRFAVEDAEISSSGIHIGGGIELHYHADGHAFNGNGINLYNLADYVGNNHPPVIGISYDGIALFGKYETSFSSMAGFGIALDSYGGHDHGDGFGYHYHAHSLSVTAANPPNQTFDEHFLLVGAWKGNINNIPGFLEVKTNQLMDDDNGRFAGASYTVLGVADFNTSENMVIVFPNPTKKDEILINIKQDFMLSIFNIEGKVMQTIAVKTGTTKIYLKNYANGIYFIKGYNGSNSFSKKIIVGD